MEKDVLPYICDRAVRSITPTDIVEIVRRVVERGAEVDAGCRGAEKLTSCCRNCPTPPRSESSNN